MSVSRVIEKVTHGWMGRGWKPTHGHGASPSPSIRARVATDIGDFGRFAHRSSTTRSWSGTDTTAFGRPRPATHLSYDHTPQKRDQLPPQDTSRALSRAWS